MAEPWMEGAQYFVGCVCGLLYRACSELDRERVWLADGQARELFERVALADDVVELVRALGCALTDLELSLAGPN